MPMSAHLLPITLQHAHVAFELFSRGLLMVEFIAQVIVDTVRSVTVELHVAKRALVRS